MDAKLLLLNFLAMFHVAESRKFKIRRLTVSGLWPSFGYVGVKKYIGIFGIKIVSQTSVCERNLQYAANVLAELIDCDQDGAPDDTAVTTQIRHKKATLVLVTDNVSIRRPEEEEHNHHILITKDCDTHDIRLNIQVATLRFIVAFGLAPAYPGTLGTEKESFLQENLKIMVGDCGYAFDNTLVWPRCTGHVFYNDTSCNMECMAVEYLTSLTVTQLGITRPKTEFGRFWTIRTKRDLMAYDPRGYSLIKQVLHWLPSKRPDGNYKPGRNGYKMAWFNGVPIKDKRQKEPWEKLKNQLIEIEVF